MQRRIGRREKSRPRTINPQKENETKSQRTASLLTGSGRGVESVSDLAVRIDGDDPKAVTADEAGARTGDGTAAEIGVVIDGIDSLQTILWRRGGAEGRFHVKQSTHTTYV